MRARHALMAVAAIILAAGRSSRLGQPKQLVRLGEENLLERAIRTTHEAGCSPVVVILGAKAAEIQRQSNLASAQGVVNVEWQEGIASSIRAGVMAVQGSDAILMTCDQPAVTASHLLRLIATGQALGEPVGSAYREIQGVPAYFPGTRLKDLLYLVGDTGARSLLVSAPCIDLEGGEVDVDTPEALAALQARFPG